MNRKLRSSVRKGKKTLSEIANDLQRYFAEVNTAGIDGADYCSIAYFATTDDGYDSALYIAFFAGEDEVLTQRMNFTKSERSDF